MRVVRFALRGKARYGVLENGVIRGLTGSPFERAISARSWDGSEYPAQDMRLLAPCVPSKIIGLGVNYESHIEETGIPRPAAPLIFLKPSTAVIGPDETILLPWFARRVDYEGELGVVIGRKARHVSEESVPEYVLGYTCVNDVTERHNQKEDGQWTRAKSYDTFAPLGPWIETEVEPDDLLLETFVNGELRQSARTSGLIFGIGKLVSFISHVMTLLPGDVIATGTPAGIGRLSAGDVVEIRIEKIGILRNAVARLEEP
ncbi:MAG: fumarylacetoacetate hydrolase family protein [Dehalococcoidia bacterium]|nr:fumarylacetoacetate hydrolase family protein [Dehalococcoidia bacterium]